MEDPELRQKLYELAKGPVHQAARAKVIKSHLSHAPEFRNFEHEGFVKFVVEKYLEARAANRKLSVSYIKTIIETINRYKKISTFRPNDVYKIVSNLNKAYNPENNDGVFYTIEGVKIDLAALKQPQPTLANVNQFKSNFDDKLYDEHDFEKVLIYYKNHLDNYLSSTKSRPDLIDELALLIVFMASAPRRVSEILNLTIKKSYDLIVKQETDIKSKTGTRIATLMVPTQLATVLNRYLDKLDYVDDGQRLFASNYKSMYTAYRKNYFALFGLKPVSRVFHAFRNHFAYKYYDLDAQGTKNALSHTNLKTTRSYAQKQQNKNMKANVKKFLTNNYPYQD